ncbi:MAG: hypothetical protein RSE41_00150 [Clostridia bacterium]
MPYFARNLDDTIILSTPKPTLIDGGWVSSNCIEMGNYHELIGVPEYSFLVGLTIDNSPASISLIFNK